MHLAKIHRQGTLPSYLTRVSRQVNSMMYFAEVPPQGTLPRYLSEVHWYLAEVPHRGTLWRYIAGVTRRGFSLSAVSLCCILSSSAVSILCSPTCSCGFSAAAYSSSSSLPNQAFSSTHISSTSLFALANARDSLSSPASATDPRGDQHVHGTCIKTPPRTSKGAEHGLEWRPPPSSILAPWSAVSPLKKANAAELDYILQQQGKRGGQSASKSARARERGGQWIEMSMNRIPMGLVT